MQVRAGRRPASGCPQRSTSFQAGGDAARRHHSPVRQLGCTRNPRGVRETRRGRRSCCDRGGFQTRPTSAGRSWQCRCCVAEPSRGNNATTRCGRSGLAFLRGCCRTSKNAHLEKCATEAMLSCKDFFARIVFENRARPGCATASSRRQYIAETEPPWRSSVAVFQRLIGEWLAERVPSEGGIASQCLEHPAR